VIYKLPSKDKDRMTKGGAIFSLLWTLVWFVGNITVSRFRIECINLISLQNLDHFEDFQVTQKCRNYCFEECIRKLIDFYLCSLRYTCISVISTCQSSRRLMVFRMGIQGP